MYEDEFSPWVSWPNRNELLNIKFVGVYALALSDRNIGDTSFTWRKEIIYIGMTTAILGLKGRMKQFDNTILGKKGHGGADRVLYKHRDYNKLVQNLYVAVAPFKCDVKTNKPEDLRIMGDVARFEYLCLAHFVEKFGELPEFNNKMKSPKYSKSVGNKLTQSDNLK